MLEVGTVLVEDSEDRSRDVVFANVVKHGEVHIVASPVGLDGEAPRGLAGFALA